MQRLKAISEICRIQGTGFEADSSFRWQNYLLLQASVYATRAFNSVCKTRQMLQRFHLIYSLVSMALANFSLVFEFSCDAVSDFACLFLIAMLFALVNLNIIYVRREDLIFVCII